MNYFTYVAPSLRYSSVLLTEGCLEQYSLNTILFQDDLTSIESYTVGGSDRFSWNGDD